MTFANRVINIDPWWNTTVEQQAFGRLACRGQEKETHFVRIFADVELEKHIHTIQSSKLENIDRMLQDDHHKRKQLTEKQ